MSHKNRNIILLALIAIVPPLMGAGNFVVAKAVIDEFPPIALAFWRWTFAWLILLPFAFKELMADREIIRENLKSLSIIAVTGIALFNCLTYTAAKYTQSINLSIIANMFPIFVVLLSAFFLKERMTPLKIVAIFFAFFGSFVVINRGFSLSSLQLFANVGDYIALLASLTWGLYTLSVKKKPKGIKHFSFLFSTIFIGWLMLVPLFAIENSLVVEHNYWNTRSVISVLFLSVGVSIIGLNCYYQTVSNLGAVTASMIFYLAPIFNIILASAFLGETFASYHLIGGVLILLGINLPLLEKGAVKAFTTLAMKKN